MFKKTLPLKITLLNGSYVNQQYMYGVLGLGAWGGAIYRILEENGHDVLGFARSSKGFKKETADMQHFLQSVDVIFIAIPTSEIASLCHNIKHDVIICSKGILSQESILTSSLFKQENCAVLSGPNFASELLNKAHTITTVATKSNTFGLKIKNSIETEYFEVELTDDINGVQVLGIIKNIIAITVGMMDCLVYPQNLKAKIITHLYQEALVLVKYFGGKEETTSLSCGIGDIFLTCSGKLSRNYEYGFHFLESSTENKTREGLRSLMILDAVDIKLPYMHIVRECIMKKDADFTRRNLV